jgi:hypothetical protein
MIETSSTEPRASTLSPAGPIVIAAVWLFGAVALAASGVPARLQPPAPQVILLAMTAALLVAGSRIRRFHAWLFGLDWRTIVGFHITRALAGAAFLSAAQRGTLPVQWAKPSAYGDIAVAALALLVILTISPSRREARRVYLFWNVIGLVDIVGVVVGAARIAMSEPAAMAPLFRLPLAIIPLWLVPIIIASHVLLFARLIRQR